MGFKHIGDVAAETEDYIEKRRQGLIKSCKTGYDKFDKAMLGGIEYGSVISIGGRPSVGKTLYSSCLLRGIIKNNPLEELEILDFNWEMSGRSLMIRDLSADAKETYGDIISAETPVDDKMMEIFREHLKKYKTLPWYLEEEPKSTREFGDIVKRRVDANPKKKRIVRVDHSILAKQVASESSQVTMLQNLLQECVVMKKQSDIIFIILTQLNREFETRQEDGSEGSFPRKSDVFGGDAVPQASETVILLNRPASYGISLYGKKNTGGKMVQPNDLFAHVVKNRNSAPDLILHYKENFKNMSINEF